METDSRPFVCPEKNCGKSFSNEDHLCVHKKTHMSLNLGKRVSDKPLFVVDQTPTPSRFIKELDAGIFQDLHSDNPFDEQFRRAANSDHGTMIEMDQRNDYMDTLNTPCIDIMEPETMLRRKEQSPPKTVISNSNGIHSAKNGVKNSKSGGQKVVQSALALNKVIQTPVITSLSSVTAPKTKPLTVGVPTAVVVSRPNTVIAPAPMPPVSVISAPDMSNASNQQPVIQYQIVLKIDGQAVQIPALLPMDSTDIPQAVVNGVDHNQSPNLAKMKLKAALAQSNKTIPTSIGAIMENPISVKANANARPLAVRRKKDADDSEVDEKRMKFLERNREAATRCRKKRKEWVRSLEGKANELAATNQQLQKEVQCLRNEVSHLKVMLLQHKDCPITLQQMAAGQPNASSLNTIVLQSNNSQATVNMKNNVSQVSPAMLSQPAINLSRSSLADSGSEGSIAALPGEEPLEPKSPFPVEVEIVEIEVSTPSPEGEFVYC